MLPIAFKRKFYTQSQPLENDNLLDMQATSQVYKKNRNYLDDYLRCLKNNH